MIQSVRFTSGVTSFVAVPLKYSHLMEETTSSYSTLKRETRSTKSMFIHIHINVLNPTPIVHV